MEAFHTSIQGKITTWNEIILVFQSTVRKHFPKIRAPRGQLSRDTTLSDADHISGGDERGGVEEDGIA